MTIIKIVLDTKEQQRAKDEGTKRRLRCIAENRIQRNNFLGTEQKKLENDIVGAIGELATAKYLNLERFAFKEPDQIKGSVDLPPNLDVKCPRGHGRRLIVYLNDDPQKIFVLATYEQPEVWLHGWTYGHRVMKDCFLEDPVGGRPAYFVRPSVLLPMPTLKDYLVDLGYSK